MTMTPAQETATVLVVDARAFGDAAQWAARLAPSRTANPLMQGVMINATTEPDRITVTASDLETTGEHTLSGAVMSPGRFLVPGRLLAAVGKVLGKAEVRITATSRGVTVEQGRNEWQLPALDVREWPDLPDGGDVVGEVDGPTLRNALARVLTAAERLPTPPILGTVQITSDDGGLTIAATDRYRLAWADLAWQPVLDGGKVDLIVPTGFLTAAASALGAETGSVRIAATDRVITLASDSQRLTGRLGAAEWPNWRRLVPASPDSAATVVVSELAAAVDRVLAVSEGRDVKPVRITVTPEEIEIASAGLGDRLAVAHCSVSDYEGPEKVFGANPTYLATCLDAMKTDLAEIWFGAKMSVPMVFIPVNDDGTAATDYRHVVIPVHVGKVTQ